MMRLRKCIACAGVVLLAWSAGAGATLLEHLSPQQLAEMSDLVVRGRVESSQSYWNAAHTKVFTRTRITVDEAYKGAAPATIEVVQLGGTIGSLKVTVDGAPTWRRDEEVLLFAEPYDAQTYRVTGLSQGKFRIERNPATGEPYVRAPRLEGVTLLGAPAGGQDRVSSLGVPLEEFVRDALGHSSEGRVTK
jgi:hypothetical protein